MWKRLHAPSPSCVRWQCLTAIQSQRASSSSLATCTDDIDPASSSTTPVVSPQEPFRPVKPSAQKPRRRKLNRWGVRPAWAMDLVQTLSTTTNAASTSFPMSDVPFWKDCSLHDLRNECKHLGYKTHGAREELYQRLWKHYHTYCQNSRPLGLSSTSSFNSLQKNSPLEDTLILQVKGIQKFHYATAVGLVLLNHSPPQASSLSPTAESPAASPILWSARYFLNHSRPGLISEYTALWLGLHEMARLGIRRIRIQSDNNIMVQQIKGSIGDVQTPIQHMYWQVLSQMELSLEEHVLEWIPTNHHARALATISLATADSVVSKGYNDTQRVDQLPPDPWLDHQLDQQEDHIYRNQLLRRLPVPHKMPPNYQIDPQHTYTLRCDGGCRGPLPSHTAGAGMVIYDQPDGLEVWCGYKFLNHASLPQWSRENTDTFPEWSNLSRLDPIQSCNHAEYLALILVLQQAWHMGIRRATVQMDCQLVVKQMRRRHVSNTSMQPWLRRARQWAARFEHLQIQHIPRQLNERADFLANHAMDYECDYYPGSIQYRDHHSSS